MFHLFLEINSHFGNVSHFDGAGKHLVTRCSHVAPAVVVEGRLDETKRLDEEGKSRMQVADVLALDLHWKAVLL